MEIPTEFWQELNDDDMHRLFVRNGRLTRAQTLRVYQLLGREPEPGVMTVVFRTEDILRALPPRTH